MANEAHKEPTMEEILASIRKIISDDDAPAVQSNAAELTADDVVIEDAENDDFETLTPGDVVEDISLDDAMFDDGAASADEDIDLGTPETVDLDAMPEPASFDEMMGADTPADAPSDDGVSFAEEIAVPAETVPTPPPFEAAAEPTIKEPDMAATSKYEKTVLTDENTADVAAGALGKLISKMDFGGDNTIEGLVREMLKPMIKDWLDANLPMIVEEKVEAEVQRIARMAR